MAWHTARLSNCQVNLNVLRELAADEAFILASNYVGSQLGAIEVRYIDRTRIVEAWVVAYKEYCHDRGIVPSCQATLD